MTKIPPVVTDSRVLTDKDRNTYPSHTSLPDRRDDGDTGCDGEDEFSDSSYKPLNDPFFSDPFGGRPLSHPIGLPNTLRLKSGSSCSYDGTSVSRSLLVPCLWRGSESLGVVLKPLH